MVTPELSRRIERVLDAAAQSRIEGVGALPDNPLGVETRRFGSVAATLVRHPEHYYGYYNAIRGLESASRRPSGRPALVSRSRTSGRA